MNKSSKYEVSTRGDRRFSALCAKLSDGRTIEMHYQCDVKGFDIGGTNWRLGKGKAPKTPVSFAQTRSAYKAFWLEYLRINPDLHQELAGIVASGAILVDSFARRGCLNQAEILTECLKDEELQHIQEELLIQGSPEPSRFSYCTMSPFSGERCTTCGHPTSSCSCGSPVPSVQELYSEEVRNG